MRCQSVMRRDATLPSGRCDANPRVAVVSCCPVIASGLICDGLRWTHAHRVSGLSKHPIRPLSDSGCLEMSNGRGLAK